MSLFGTDGIRGRWPEHPLSPVVVAALGRALRERFPTEPIAIARDTRASGPALCESLLGGLGGEVVDLGELPTAGLSALLAQGVAAAGVMVTASHNPWWDNGVKVMGGDGRKLPDAAEAALSARVLALGEVTPALARSRALDATERYLQALRDCLPANFSLSGQKIAVDAANGAAWRTAPRLLEALGAEVVALGCAPDGRNINAGAGALHPEPLAQLVRARGCAAGIALDGDADRCVLVDESGRVVDGDGLLLLLARPPGVVGTVMCNAALERALAARGLGLERVAVGDRFVAERLRALGWPVGGEPSGHVLFSDGLPTGDGLLTGLLALAGGSIAGRLAGWHPDPQVLLNVPVSRRVPLDTLAELAEAEAAARAEGASRVLLRYSGTEPQLRVMVEAPEHTLAQHCADQLADCVRRLLVSEEV